MVYPSFPGKQSTLYLAVLLLLGACAAQQPPFAPSAPATPAPASPKPGVKPEQRAALEDLLAQQARIYRVAGPLLLRNPELCKGNARNLLGFSAKNKYSFPSPLSETALSLYGMDDRLQVTAVLPGSGAEQAGVRRGDVLLQVNGRPVPQGENAESQAAALVAPLMASRSAVSLGLLRNGEQRTLDIPLTRACAYAVEIGNSSNVNAYNDGRRVLLTRGMLAFTRSDEELAYVLAKEMAHNSLHHASRLNMTATVGDIIDKLSQPQPALVSMAGTSGVRPMPQELDAAADTLSLYMLARAGYDVSHAYAFWDRLAALHPASEMNSYTAIHPATPYRLVVMEKIVIDIKTRVAGKQPLLP